MKIWRYCSKIADIAGTIAIVIASASKKAWQSVATHSIVIASRGARRGNQWRRIPLSLQAVVRGVAISGDAFGA